MSSIAEAKNMRQGISVLGTIERKGNIRTVQTKFGKTVVSGFFLSFIFWKPQNEVISNSLISVFFRTSINVFTVCSEAQICLLFI